MRWQGLTGSFPRRIATFVIALSIAAGCARQASVPVVERPQPPSERINHHWVAEGETLYAIAWRYNMDYRALARANGLGAPYRIRRGQRLSLVPTAGTTAKPVASSRRAGRDESPAVGASDDRADASSRQTVTGRGTAASVANWLWPASGRLTRRYSVAQAGSRVHKGIDISGQHGQRVVAAADGEVVYAGSGLQAYGKLLIVKHSDTYLSAYAHNSRLLVGEGQSVKAGQKVAHMGASGTTHNHLHFEIRRRGVPVDPLALLPARNR